MDVLKSKRQVRLYCILYIALSTAVDTYVPNPFLIRRIRPTPTVATEGPVVTRRPIPISRGKSFIESFSCRSCGSELQLKYPNDRFNFVNNWLLTCTISGKKFKRRSRQCLQKTPKFSRPSTKLAEQGLTAQGQLISLRAGLQTMNEDTGSIPMNLEQYHQILKKTEEQAFSLKTATCASDDHRELKWLSCLQFCFFLFLF